MEPALEIEVMELALLILVVILSHVEPTDFSSLYMTKAHEETTYEPYIIVFYFYRYREFENRTIIEL